MASIEDYPRVTNANPKPLIWTILLTMTASKEAVKRQGVARKPSFRRPDILGK